MATEPTVDLGDLRAEVRSWLASEWSPGIAHGEWLGRVVDRGYAVPTWPREWFGLAFDNRAATAIYEEFSRVGAPGARQDRYNVWAAPLFSFGTEQLKHQLLRPILTDAVRMCFLYSEPGAGSDLAGLQTRADRDGDEFVVTGQKVWTSGAHLADYGMLVARTNWDAPKHRGISFFYFPMRQQGVEVRPIRQATGDAHFNEVFLDAARVPAANLVGTLDDGWRVLQTALAYERSTMSDNGADLRPLRTFPGASADFDLVAAARAAGVAGSPVIRQQIAYIHSLRAVHRWNAARAKAALRQGTSSPAMSIGKLAMSRIQHAGARIHARILGTEGLLVGEHHPEADDSNFMALNAYFTSIGGGTDDIQRNIIAERILGLPREPEPDRMVPFRDAPKATATRNR